MFDVFLSHNSNDKEQVEALARRLEDVAKLKPWLDKWNLVPGEPWQEAIEQALDQSRTCAVFIGPSAVGPWHNEEMRVALDRRVREKAFRVIPILLPGAKMPDRGELPTFLTRLTWVDFRRGIDEGDAFHLFVCGVTGKPPGRRDGQPDTVKPVECPYRGLEVFDEEHTRFFFGREAMTQHLVEALRSTRFLCVVGPSGSGKSSLARAGLLPQLRACKLPSSHLWQYIVFKPGAHPIEELALNLATLQITQDQIGTATQLINNFKTSETALHLFARFLLQAQPTETRLFILVDQFEEVFTLCQDSAEREQFIKNLRYAGTIDGGRTCIVPTMRADFLARAAESSDLAELLSTHQFIVNLIEPDDLRRTIEEPACLAGLRLEPGLVERILNDLGSEPGTLPLLQYALFELYAKRSSDNMMTMQAYEASGGVQGSLAQKAEALYSQFTPEQQIVLRRMMLRLTQPGEGATNTRRRAFTYEMWSKPEEKAVVEEIVKMLTDMEARLLTTSVDANGEQQIDVAHEALIRGWPRLNHWINGDREGLRLHHRLSEDAKEWRKQSKDQSYLYRGARLMQAAAWGQNNDAELNEVERDFLGASLALESLLKEEKEERRQVQLKWTRIFAVIISVALVVVGTLAIYGLKQQRRAQDQERYSRLLFYDASMNLVQQAIDKNDYSRSLELLDQFLKQDDVRCFYWYYLWQLNHNESATLKSHENHVWSVTFSSDGKMLATGGGDETVRLWDANTGQLLNTLRSDGVIWSVAFAPDGKALASGSYDKTVKLWDVSNGQLLRTLEGHESGVTSVAFAPNGKTLASGSGKECDLGGDKTVNLWDVSNGQLLMKLKGHRCGVTSVAFTSDGKTLASGSYDGKVKLWDVSSRQLLRTLEGHESGVTSVAFAPSGKTLASGGGDKTVKLWDANTGQLLNTLNGHEWFVTSVAFAPDGKTLASGDGVASGMAINAALRLWDVRTGQLLNTLRGHENSVWSVAFAPDGKTLATGSADKMVKLWTARTRKLPDTLESHDIYSVAFAPDGKTLISGHDDKTVKLWDVRTGQLLNTLKGHEEAVLSIASSSDGKTLVSGSNDNTVKLWDLRTGQLLTTLRSKGPTWSMAFAPGGKNLAAAVNSGTIELWDLRIGQSLNTLEIDDDEYIESVAYAPDGKTLAIGTTDGGGLWDAQTGKWQKKITAGDVRIVAFAPDGKMLACGGRDNAVKLWDISAGQLLNTLKGHEGEILSLAYTSDGKTLASGSKDKTVKLWDARTGQLLSTLKGQEDSVTDVIFAADGKMLVIRTANKKVKLFFATRDEEVTRQRTK